MRVKSLCQLLELQVGDQLLALVGERPDVQVLAVATAPEQIHGDVAQVFGTVRDVHEHHPTALEKAVVVLPHAEDEQLALVFVPVSADALEYGRPVVEGVGHNADLRIFDRNYLSTEEGK